MRNTMPPGLLDSDFATIHAAVMETARGRWFLDEYARRNRMADTRMILDAMAKLEHAVAAGPAALAAPDAMAEPDSVALDAPLADAAAQIGERLAGIGWDLRESGFADDICAALDRQAEAAQDLARQLGGGSARAATALARLDDVLPALPQTAPATAEVAPPIAAGAALPEFALSTAPPDAIALPAPIIFGPELRASMHAALAHLDALPLQARLEMFV